jgi:hypothetical protein
LSVPLLQLVTQRVEFSHAGFDQFQFVLQQLRHGPLVVKK